MSTSLSHGISTSGLPRGSTVLQDGVITDPETNLSEYAKLRGPDSKPISNQNVVQTKQDPPFQDLNALPTYKPPLVMFPPIWAQSRQEVCESFDWFRSYQSGVYHSGGIVKGYLLSAFASHRDIFEHGGKLIISHGGGKAESIHCQQGQIMVMSADDQHAQDKSVRALIKNYEDARPLVLLIDDKYTLFPYDLGAKDVTYAVLGFYIITHVWAEYQPAHNLRGRVIRYKFSFQWCQGQGEPWWYPREKRNNADYIKTDNCIIKNLKSKKLPEKKIESKFSDLGISSLDYIYVSCRECRKRTPQVYQQIWVCLNPACTRFWTAPDGSEPPTLLEYNANFLQLSPSFVLPSNFTSIFPEQPISSPKNGITTTYAFSRGWHCPKCGRLSCRFKWEHWECSNCAFICNVSGKFRSPRDFWTQKISASFHDHAITKSSAIVQEPVKIFWHKSGMGQAQSFILPDGRGRIHHIQSGAMGAMEADGIFERYQKQAAAADLAFRRWPLRTHKCRGPLLTNYFSQNSGEPYQYVGGTENTVPFNKAPGAVVEALEFIKVRIKQALDITSSFNEILSAAYMERQKMAFHSDSEPGLGPLVAGLSLGSPALMHFRRRTKNPAEKYIAISFALRHGDVLVMDGAGVQEYYEHTVIPTNFRIAATARQINPTHS